MAKKLTQEDIKLNLIVNGNQAQAEYSKLSRTIRDANFELKAVKSELKAMEAEGKANTASYKDLTKQMKDLQKTIDTSKLKQKELTAQMRIEDKTIEQLNKSLRSLRASRSKVAPDSKEYKDYTEQLQLTRQRLSELEYGANQTGKSLLNMGGGVNRYMSSVIAGVASVTALVSGINRAKNEFAEFDDIMSDVQKTTNATKEEVIELDKALHQLDTRTSDEDLLGLGRIAGKLGYSDLDEIQEFIGATNQIVVALNQDLGGNVEETVNKIGKLVDIFQLRDLYDTEDAFLKVGSAINELGMASTANEGYMVEFARRMAGIAPLAGISIEEILGLGATLDQLGQTAEVSSTSLSKLFLGIAKDAETYAKYAGMQVTEFKDLLEKDFMQAFTKVLRGVQGSSEGINQLAATLGDLGQDGGRVIGVIGSLANNVDVLQQQIDLSNKAMQEGTSITEEYNIKNSNAAAQLDIARKEVRRLWRELGEKLWPVITSGNNLMIIFIKALTSIVGFVAKYSKSISILTLTIISYYTALQVAAKWELISNGYKIAKRAILLSLNVVYGLLTGNITRATAAQKLLNITMTMNPVGGLIALIVGLTTALIAYSERTTAARYAQQKLNEEIRIAKERAEELKSATTQLVSAINDINSTRYDQARAFLELQKLYPNLLQNMSLEEFQSKDSTEALMELNKAREEQEKLLIRTNYSNAIKSVENLKTQINELTASLGGPNDRGVYNAIKKLSNELVYAEEQVKHYGKQIEEINKIEFNAQPLAKKLEHYKEVEQGLNTQIQKLKDQRLLVQDINQGWSTFNDWVNQITMQGLITQLNTVESKIKSLTEQSEIAKEDKTVGGRRKELESELKSLTSIYETLSADDIKARQKNLEARRQIQSQLDALDGRSSRGNKSSSDAKTKAEAIEREKQYWNEITIAQEDGYNRELHQLEKRWQTTKKILGKEHPDIEKLETAYINQKNKIKSDLEEKAHIERMKKEREYREKTLKQLDANANEEVLKEKQKNQDKLLEIDRSNQSAEQKQQEIENATAQHNENLNFIETKRLTHRLIMLEEIKEQGELEIEEEQRIVDEILRIRGMLIDREFDMIIKANRAKEKEEKDLIRATYELKEEQAKAFEAGFALLGNLVQESVAAANAMLVLEKAAAAATVIINLQKEIALISASYAVLSPIAAALIAKSKVRAGISLATIAGTTISGIASNSKKQNKVSGRESGGFFDITREQDGRSFRSRYRPDQRGYVDRPTVLVGENGTEWVASAQALSNPDVSRIISILDTAQRQGQISTIGLSDILTQSGLVNRMAGRDSGGSFTETPIINNTTDFTSIEAVLAKNIELMEGLKNELSQGINAKVSLLGRDGFIAKQAELDKIRKNANL